LEGKVATAVCRPGGGDSSAGPQHPQGWLPPRPGGWARQATVPGPCLPPFRQMPRPAVDKRDRERPHCLQALGQAPGPGRFGDVVEPGTAADHRRDLRPSGKRPRTGSVAKMKDAEYPPDFVDCRGHGTNPRDRHERRTWYLLVPTPVLPRGEMHPPPAKPSVRLTGASAPCDTCFRNMPGPVSIPT
jgi:hypothetical protein